ncbi:hypothetical protein ACFU6S_09560 [Streptomyces sp. NPDC057456]|uniref:hypothetical protein n=1 Tax=Streptomyces sp. NPDC057456 TaxID=3346139 RepID=UPI00369BDBC7
MAAAYARWSAELSAVERGGSHWALPGPLLPAEPARAIRAPRPWDVDRKLTRWVHRQGGAEVGVSPRRITFQGVDRTIIITGMRAVVLERGPVLDGTFVNTGLGGAEPPLVVEIDLDSDRPEAAFFTDQVITVAVGENVAVDLRPTVNRPP